VTTATIRACDWCRRSFIPNTIGRPRRYCSVACRRDHGHYVDALPGWTARLADLEASAASYRRIPTFIRNEMAEVRAAIDGRPTLGPRP
jgi:hypothetical protein